jgi:DDE domain
MLLERGIDVSYETIRRWGKKHGREYAWRLRRKPASKDDIWHLDEVVVRINGEQHWLWRAVDQDGYVLDEIVQKRRNTKAARRLLIHLLPGQPRLSGSRPQQLAIGWIVAQRWIGAFPSTDSWTAESSGFRVCGCVSSRPPLGSGPPPPPFGSPSPIPPPH